jgi:hypothetical protein
MCGIILLLRMLVEAYITYEEVITHKSKKRTVIEERRDWGRQRQ